ncbi:regulatory protein RecX [Rhizobacter sp. Root1221]|uniref:regulatory protein RecX n=1 Tax=Rhizobacter sp. Root1221 TaxID=1736433 RepID=UPI003518579D
MKPKLSLKGRGLQYLAQREHSRSELRQKLLRHARAEAAAACHPAACHPGESRDLHRPGFDLPGAGQAEPPPSDTPATSPEDTVDAILDWLQAHRYLSEERFVESRVHARASRYGNLRIRQELAQHGVTLSAEEARSLKDSEFARARDVWRRKFGEPPADAADRARQMRFLGGRGFSPEVIRRVVQGGSSADDD